MNKLDLRLAIREWAIVRGHDIKEIEQLAGINLSNVKPEVAMPK